MVKSLYLSGAAILFAAAFTATMSDAKAQTAQKFSEWEYSEIKDQFTDKTHHIALIRNTSPLASDDFRASFECRNGKEFIFTLDARKYLGKRNAPFEIQYRVDDRSSKTVKMRTFSNSETGGMNKYSAIDIANDVLNAERLRIRAFADNGDQYDSEVSLKNSRQSILRAVRACGLNVR